MEPVFIKLKWKTMVLVETEQEMEDGRRRTRNMVIAEKKEPRDENVFATSIRGLYEELGVSLEILRTKGALKFREDMYCCRTEYMDSSSYPGSAQHRYLHDVTSSAENKAETNGTNEMTTTNGDYDETDGAMKQKG